MALFQPGHPRIGGRIKGTPNRVDGDIKRMVCAALAKAGGVDYLVEQASKNPVAFMGLVGKVLPLQVTGAGGEALQIRIVRYSESEAKVIEGEIVDQPSIAAPADETQEPGK